MPFQGTRLDLHGHLLAVNSVVDYVLYSEILLSTRQAGQLLGTSGQWGFPKVSKSAVTLEETKTPLKGHRLTPPYESV